MGIVKSEEKESGAGAKRLPDEQHKRERERTAVPPAGVRREGRTHSCRDQQRTQTKNPKLKLGPGHGPGARPQQGEEAQQDDEAPTTGRLAAGD